MESITGHPQFSKSSMDFDLAVVHLSSEFIEGPNAKAIELACQAPPAGAKVTITGFGFTQPDATTPAEHLQIANRMEVSFERF